MTTHRASLLGLPAELRNTIYELALPTETQVVAFCAHRFADERPAVPGLLQTCQLLRRETLPIYYGSAKFEFSLFDIVPRAADQAAEDLWQWLSHLDGVARQCLLENAQVHSEVKQSRGHYGLELRELWRLREMWRRSILFSG